MNNEKLSAVPVCENSTGAKNQKFDAATVWKQIEDLAIPGLQLTVFERAVYYHLMRHSQLEGKARLRFSIKAVARGACLSDFAVRKAVRGLMGKGALRLSERSKRGHEVEVRLPEEIRGLRADKNGAGDGVGQGATVNLEEIDFLATPELREAIHEREGGRCFYCGRRMKPGLRCLDHVVPQVEMGGNSYRNLVSSCMDCNAQKTDQKAEDFLRWLFPDGQLSEEELKGRLRAVQELAAGKMQPRIEGNPVSNPTTKKRFAARIA